MQWFWLKQMDRKRLQIFKRLHFLDNEVLQKVNDRSKRLFFHIDLSR